MQETYNYCMGRRGEVVACALFAGECWGAVPTNELGTHGAPVQLRLDTANVILPDLDISKFGSPRMWVDAKTKTRFFIWRKTHRKQTGIEARHLEHYRRMELLTGAPVVLCMIDCETGDVLCNTLSGLGEPRYSPVDEYPLANWDRDRFYRLWTVNPKRLNNLVKRETLPPPISKDVLRRTLDYLRPRKGEQSELPLFHSDVFAECTRLSAGRC